MMSNKRKQTKYSHVLDARIGMKIRIVRHIVNNTAFLLCLNCDDWIHHKEMVITPGWTLFDANGALRYNVLVTHGIRKTLRGICI
jgi:hypothetical protein